MGGVAIFATFTRPERLRYLRGPLRLYQRTGLSGPLRRTGFLQRLAPALAAMEAAAPPLDRAAPVPEFTSARGTRRGTVGMVHYSPGRFAFANTAKASRENESNAIGIGGEPIKVVVKQIAGAVARRIVCYCKPDQSVQTGERIGIIRFGSRTELYLPPECKILVSVGQKVKGGLSLVGAYDATSAKKTQAR